MRELPGKSAAAIVATVLASIVGGCDTESGPNSSGMTIVDSAGVDLIHYDRTNRRNIPCDPSGTAAAPWKHRIPASASHGGRDHSKAEKAASKWEWVELPMPKYTTSGLKTFKMIGLSKGMAVAAAVVSRKRTKPPDAAEIAELARVVLEIGKVKPHKRKRLSFLARNHHDLILKLEETGLIWVCN